jgi:DNA mismatch repair protein MutS
MVEMVETATILNQATDRSLVILDEIGRGTATFDGLSIAWAVVEYLYNKITCRGLFATHYHELTALTDTLKSLYPATMKVKEWEDEIIFLHEVAQGTADRSYGIHVAKLSGLPEGVINRANQVLSLLEKQKSKQTTDGLMEELPLFSLEPEPLKPEGSEIEHLLKSLDIDGLSPREALDTLYDLKNRLKNL